MSLSSVTMTFRSPVFKEDYGVLEVVEYHGEWMLYTHGNIAGVSYTSDVTSGLTYGEALELAKKEISTFEDLGMPVDHYLAA